MRVVEPATGTYYSSNDFMLEIPRIYAISWTYIYTVWNSLTRNRVLHQALANPLVGARFSLLLNIYTARLVEGW